MSVVTIRDYSYYENLVPLCYKEDTSFMCHFQYWYELAYLTTTNIETISVDIENYINKSYNGIIGSADIYLALLNIFNNDYYDNLISTFGSYVTKQTTCDILQKLFDFFNLNTSITVVVDDVTYSIDLSICAQIIYLRSTIIKSFCTGTLEEELSLYELSDLNITINWNNENSAYASYIYIDNNFSNDVSLYYLFMGGELHIAHMGIAYELIGYYSSDDTTLRWASNTSTKSYVHAYSDDESTDDDAGTWHTDGSNDSDTV